MTEKVLRIFYDSPSREVQGSFTSAQCAGSLFFNDSDRLNVRSVNRNLSASWDGTLLVVLE